MSEEKKTPNQSSRHAGIQACKFKQPETSGNSNFHTGGTVASQMRASVRLFVHPFDKNRCFRCENDIINHVVGVQFNCLSIFLVACAQLYNSLCRSVDWSVCLSLFFFYFFELFEVRQATYRVANTRLMATGLVK